MDHAIATCALKVDVCCRACKMYVLEVLGSINGVYDVNIDADQGVVLVHGVVDPNFLMKAVTRTGSHAELKYVKLHHPQARRNYFDDYDYPHSFGPFRDPYYSYAGSLPYDGFSNYTYPMGLGLGPSYCHGPGYMGGYMGLPPIRSAHTCRPRPFAPY